MAVAQGEEDKTEASGRSSAAARLSARRAARAAAKASKRGTAPIMPSRIARAAQSAGSLYTQNQRALWTGLGGGIAAAAIWIGASYYLSKQGKEAAELLGTAITTAIAPVVEPGSEPPAGQAPEESYPNAKARAEKARDEFGALIKRFPDAAAAAWGRLVQANELNDLGKRAEAEKVYAQLLAGKDLDPFVHWRALEGLGFALEAQQKYADASKRFEQIGAIENGAYKTSADFHRARMLILSGQPQKAAEILQALVKAERARPPGEGMHFEGIVSDAETMLTELSVTLNSPKLRVDLPGATPTAPTTLGPSQGSGTGLTKEIVEALRKQLESGKGGKGLSKDIVEQLEKQVKTGNSTTTTVRVPAPKSEGKEK
jgi:tetratricopeptide (TPR) repeat protein